MYICQKTTIDITYMKNYFVTLLLIIALLPCGIRKTVAQVADNYSYFLIDSILQHGLDHEALFTLFGDVKPMSSLVTFTFPIINWDSIRAAGTVKISSATLVSSSSSTPNQDSLKSARIVMSRKDLDRMFTIQKAINCIDIPDIKVVIIPYSAPGMNHGRTIQLTAVRISTLDSLLRAKESFFGHYGLVPGTDPNVVVSTIENAERFERLRGYGYLFGYPDYAVDFFVEAQEVHDGTGQFVERNFFQIPTYSGAEGYFVYAYPKNVTPTAALDSALYYRAGKVLDQYKNIRNNYLNADSTVMSYKLLKDHSR